MNQPQDFFALMGCVLVLATCWHVMRHQRGPHGPSLIGSAIQNAAILRALQRSMAKANKAAASFSHAILKYGRSPR
jgi:hypothetical protein